MADVKIKKIEIKIDKKTINLSLNQAKELKAALDDLFKQEAYYPYYSVYPQHYIGDYQWSYTTGGEDNTSGGIAILNLTAK